MGGSQLQEHRLHRSLAAFELSAETKLTQVIGGRARWPFVGLWLLQVPSIGQIQCGWKKPRGSRLGGQSQVGCADAHQ